MPSVHIVKQGECLSSIARHHGFADYRTIYDHASNQALRESRPNPHVLFPGDRIAIPDPAQKEVKVATAQRHTFQVKSSKIFLHLDVLGHVAGEGVQARYQLRLDGAHEALEGSIGADGKLDVVVAHTATTGELTLLDPDTDEIIDIVDIRIGALDPATTVSGVRSRLRRLGFDCGGEVDELGPLTQGAIALFQRVHAIEEEGEAGPLTRAKLVKLAGA